MKIGINGRFLTRRITGVERYARELLSEYDQIISDDEACILVPLKCELVDFRGYKHIKLIRYGNFTGHAWEQIDFRRYLEKNHLIGLNLCGSAPVINPGIVCWHDVHIKVHPEFFSKRFVLWYTFTKWIISRTAKCITTVSHFSKSEIEKYYPETVGKIVVIPNAWQHIRDIPSDDSILESNGLEKGNYWFALSSLAPNKNLNWIAKTAMLTEDATIAVAGGINAKVFGKADDIPSAQNLKYIGYVTDSQIKALLKGCKGFLFPTFYEGFGIPPMEALACGAPAIVSDTTVMHEIYNNSVSYCNPNIPMKLPESLPFNQNSVENVLREYSWKSSAEILNKLIHEI